MDIRTVNVETNGLGEVIREDQPFPNSDPDYVYYRHVFFKPNNGVRFYNIIKDEKVITGTTSNPSQNVKNYDPVYSTYSPISSNSSLQEHGKEKIGWMYLGREYKNTDASTLYADEWYQKVVDYTITGEPNQISLTVAGEEGYGSRDGNGDSSTVIIQYVSGLSQEEPLVPTTPHATTTFVRRTTIATQTYTNIVGFDKQNKMIFHSDLKDTRSSSSNFISISGNNKYQKDIGICEYTTDDFDAWVNSSSEDTVPSRIKVYVNCRICVFNLSTTPCEEIDSGLGNSKFKHKVRSMWPGVAEGIRRDSFDREQLPGMYFGQIDIPNGCLTFLADYPKKYLYPDIKVKDYIQDSDYSNDQRLASMVNANTGTIPEDLLWIEDLEDGFGKKISRYTHVVRLCYDGDDNQLDEFVSAESNYARFTGYWYVQGSHWDKDKKTTYKKYKFLKETSSIPSTGGNLIFHPVFKPFAECDLLIHTEENPTFPERYANFFLERLNNKYYIGEGKSFRKSWYVNASGDFHTLENRIKDFIKTVSPYKNLIIDCPSQRFEYIPDNETYNGTVSIHISPDKLMSPQKLNVIANDCKYWWNGDDWGHNLCFGLFSPSSFSSGWQLASNGTIAATRPQLGNCTVKDSEKIVPDLEDMFFCLGASATEYNWINEDLTLELPIMDIAGDGITTTYSHYCKTFNDTVQNLKTEVFKEITKFYVKYFNDMVKCLDTEEDKYMWNRTYDDILDDLKYCGKLYFHIPYRELGDPGWDSPDSKIHIDGTGYEDDEIDYYVHDGFVGLIRKYILGMDKTNNKKFFRTFNYVPPVIPDSEMTDQELLDKEMYDTRQRLGQGLRKLNTEIENIIKAKLGNDCPKWMKKIAISEPICGCSGAYKTATVPLMANPYHEYDEWLADDSELVKLEELTNAFIVNVPKVVS